MADCDIVRAASHLDHCNYNLIIIQMRLAACACETPDTISTIFGTRRRIKNANSQAHVAFFVVIEWRGFTLMSGSFRGRQAADMTLWRGVSAPVACLDDSPESWHGLPRQTAGGPILSKDFIFSPHWTLASVVSARNWGGVIDCDNKLCAYSLPSALHEAQAAVFSCVEGAEPFWGFFATRFPDGVIFSVGESTPPR